MRTQERKRNQQNSGLILTMGIIMLMLGIIALTSPCFLTSIAVELMYAWLLLIYGIVQFIYALKSGNRGRILFKLLFSIISIVAAIFLLVYPLAGVFTLTLVLGFYIFLDGVFRVVRAFQLRPLPKWDWILFNGIVSIILGILIWSQMANK
ncbi:HdeD family acid-resistance protein [Pleurocapsa sp. FMAR1]|uniref:HdeD family acid-resistance protein n=1 Tax=Pleurocapsa sp. FMAR1 TaxID=3040204 RepID=UPI0029C99B20|nr:DUF308 domain-containing protein [Pleurocapsa sp. FMAR1]